MLYFIENEDLNQKPLHELQVNGQEVGTEENEEPTDYTATDGDNDGAQTTDAPDENTDGPEDNPEDYEVPDDNEEGNEEGQEGEGEGNPEEGGEEGEGGEGEGEEGEGDEGGEEPPAEPEQEPSPYDAQIADLEKDIYGDLTDQQFTIRDRELKQNFSKFYDDIQELVTRINDMAKSEELLKPLEFVANNLSDLGERVSDYLTYTYSTKTYSENLVNYNLFLDVMRKINEMLTNLKQ